MTWHNFFIALLLYWCYSLEADVAQLKRKVRRLEEQRQQ